MMISSLKRFLSGMIATVLLIAISSSHSKTIFDELAYAVSDGSLIYGDINNDGIIDVFDLSLLRDKYDDEGYYTETADVNGDGIVDIYDVYEIQQYLLRRIDCFSIEYKNQINNVDRTIVTSEGIPEIELTAEMVDKANELGTPLNVFNYIKNNIHTEFYIYSRKGARGTYEQYGGNDIDQSSLLIAMLTYLGYEAVYATGDALLSADDILNLTGVTNLTAALEILRTQGRNVSEEKQNGINFYRVERTFVITNIDNITYYFDPSFKEYVISESALDNLEFSSIPTADIENLVSTGSVFDLQQYLYELDLEYDKYGKVAISNSRKIKYEEALSLPTSLPYNYDATTILQYETISDDMSDLIMLKIQDDIHVSVKSSFLYGKNLSISYDVTEANKNYIKNIYPTTSVNNIFDLSKYNFGYDIGINAVVKADDEIIGFGSEVILGNFEDITIGIRSGGKVSYYNKEIIAGGSYSFVFDYQIISSQDLLSSVANLPQTEDEKALVSSPNIYQDGQLRNLLDIVGKTYFSQVDFNNNIFAEINDVHTEREISVCVVSFEPDIYQGLLQREAKSSGSFEIDVLRDMENCISYSNEEDSVKNYLFSSGITASSLEGSAIQQILGVRTVSTMAVLEQSAQAGKEIKIISNANQEELSNLSISENDLAEIETAISNGYIVTVPESNITIDSWTGTGFIIYDPDTYAMLFRLSEGLNGGGATTIISLAYLADTICFLFDCKAAISIIAASTTLMLTSSIVLGLGGVLLGAGILKASIEIYTDMHFLMMSYMDGNEEAGKELLLNSAFYVGGNVLGAIGAKFVTKPILNKILGWQFVRNTGSKVMSVINTIDNQAYRLLDRFYSYTGEDLTADMLAIILRDSKVLNYSDDVITGFVRLGTEGTEKAIQIASKQGNEFVQSLNKYSERIDRLLDILNNNPKGAAVIANNCDELVMLDDFSIAVHDGTMYGDNFSSSVSAIAVDTANPEKMFLACSGNYSNNPTIIDLPEAPAEGYYAYYNNILTDSYVDQMGLTDNSIAEELKKLNQAIQETKNLAKIEGKEYVYGTIREWSFTSNHSVSNCAEVWAAREAILQGSKLDNLHFLAIENESRLLKEPCGNCIYTFAGKSVLEGISVEEYIEELFK